MQSRVWFWRQTRLVAVCIAALLAGFWLSATPLMSQDAGAGDSVQDAETAQAFPAGLDQLDMDVEEFKLRLIPLTVSELSALAAHWQDIVRGQTEAVVVATIEVKNETTVSEANDQLDALSDARNQGFERYRAVVNNLEKKGGDEAEVASHRAYRTAIIIEEKQQSDWATLLRQSYDWVFDSQGGIKLAISIGVIVASFIGLLLVARIVRGYSVRLMNRVPNLSKLLKSFLSKVVYWVAIIIGLTVVLSSLGVDVTPIFALVGGASFVLAFALQDTLGNLAAGLMIMFNRPFDEGDYINAGGTAGTVKSVSVFSTKVMTPDNQEIVIPNSRVWGDVITNATASNTRRVDLVFGIDYGDDADKAIRTILDVAEADARVLRDPEPWVRVTNLGDSSVDLTARIWCASADYWELKFALTKEVKAAFDTSGISIPYPHSVEIHKAG